jgi:hypothetical protein
MSSELKVDTISEKTSANGVTIDSVLIKDGEVDGVDVSAITQGITNFDLWSLNADHSTADVIPGSKFSRPGGTLQGQYKGTGMSVDSTSGHWTFPTTGLWLVSASVTFVMGSSDRFTEILINSSDDDFSTQDVISRSETGNNTSNTAGGNVVCNVVIDITDTSNDKIEFSGGSFSSGTYARGSTSHDYSTFTFIRLGDT